MPARAVWRVIILVIAIGTTFLVWTFQRNRHVTNAVSTSSGSEDPSLPADQVQVDDNQLKQITVEPVGEKKITLDRETTGRIAFNADRLTPVFTAYPGRVVELLANKGDRISRGAALLSLESPDVVSAQNDLAAARSDLAKAKIGSDLAHKAAERAKELYEHGALAAKELQQAEADLARAQYEETSAQAVLASVQSRFELFGKQPDEIAQMGRTVDRRIVIRAPISGTVVDRKVGPGQYIKPDSPDPLFLISDLSTLWVWADVFESDIAWVKLNAPAAITIAAYPDRSFPGHISFISPTVDPATRTIRVRCLLENREGLLKPDMFAKIKVTTATAQSLPFVPASAVISQQNSRIVFLDMGAGRFRARKVEVKQEIDGYVALGSGVKTGERVVTRGGLLLNELIKARKFS